MFCICVSGVWVCGSAADSFSHKSGTVADSLPTSNFMFSFVAQSGVILAKKVNIFSYGAVWENFG